MTRTTSRSTSTTATDLDHLRRVLCALQDYIRDTLVGARGGVDVDAAITAVTEADTIYGIDRVADEAIAEWLELHWPDDQPAELVSEGLDASVRIGSGEARWTLILDPIDGTRGLMYDKRSAWALAGLAPHGGSLAAIEVAVMTELPTTKQSLADQISAVRGAGVLAERVDVATGQRSPLVLRPSRATDLEHGWASFARFFPPAKALLAAFEETLWRGLYGHDRFATLAIFDDQYLSTGGQFHELVAGHDRMLGDLRPLAFAALGLDDALSCHPYDCCTALVLQESGCVVTDPWGGALDVPLDTTSPVAWVAFANAAIAERVRPALDAALAAHFGR